MCQSNPLCEKKRFFFPRVGRFLILRKIRKQNGANKSLLGEGYNFATPLYAADWGYPETAGAQDTTRNAKGMGSLSSRAKNHPNNCQSKIEPLVDWSTT